MKTEERDFESYLMEKYPSLFNTDADGKLLPPDCGIYCPPGWQPLVDRLCKSIVWRVKNNCIYEPKRFFAMRLRNLVWSGIFRPLRDYIDPKTKHFKTRRLIPVKELNSIENSHPIRTRIVKKYFRCIQKILIPQNKYKTRPIPEVKIGQIKEKFGTLRFYYDGGDDVIAGMVMFAEALTDGICEITGEAGSLCKKSKGSWYKTLSERKANEIGYTKVE